MSVQDNINKLLWDRRIIILDDDMDHPNDLEYIVLRDLRLEDRNYYTMIHDLEEHKARKAGVSTEGEVLENARSAGYWTQVEEDIESKADQHIEFLEAEFVAKSKFKSRQNIIKLQIEDAQAKKSWVQRKRSEFRMVSAEYMAHEIACMQLLRRVCYRPDDSLLIPDEQSLLFLKHEYFQMLFFLISEMMHEGILPTPEIREIARSVEWRLIWSLSRENLSSIFNRPICDLTLNHKLLIYWSRVYDSAFESPNPPDLTIVNDNDQFDQWLASRDLNRKDETSTKNNGYQEQGTMLDGEYIEKCTCGAKDINKGKYLGERVRHNQDCLYGTWHKFTEIEKEQRAQHIYGKNSKHMRQLINSQHEKVLQRGVIEEQHLRGQKTRELLGMKTNVIPIRRR